MPAAGAQPPAPPDDIRPGQLGVVILRRVIIGDVAATLVDLSLRHLLRLEEPQGEQGGWLITPSHANAPRYRRESLLTYEQTLLDGLSRGGAAASLASLAPGMPGVLEQTRAAVLHDAVHRGWLRRLHHDQRTEAGEQLAGRIRTFQRGLRRLAAERGEDALAGPLLPYALHFAMIRGAQYPLVRFAHDWVETFAGLPGWRQAGPKPHNPLNDPVPMNNAGPNWRGYTSA
jgi:hypothetical protein